MINYGYTKMLNCNMEEAEKVVEDNLSKVGFSVVSRLDLQEKFKNKLNIDYKKYVILGVCSPANAYKAIELEENIGLLLPCNVILYEKGSGINVAIIKPTIAMSVVNNSELNSVAEHIEKELISCIKRLPV